MILIAGGTGTLGTALVRRLRARDLPVRVLTRERARANHLRGDGGDGGGGGGGVDIATGDLRDPASLRAALDGVNLVVAAAHGFGDDDRVSPASVDRSGNINLIDAATGAGASVVLMSGVHASPNSPLELFRAKFDAEQHTRASTVPWTIIRATAFVETWAGVMGPPLLDTGRTMVFGRGENPINFVSVTDVAALLECVVLDAKYRGEVIEVGGSANITFKQFAQTVGESLGRASNARHIPRAALRTLSVIARPFKPSFARHAGAAVFMDTHDMTFDDSALRRRFPALPNTDIRTALDSYFAQSQRRTR